MHNKIREKARHTIVFTGAAVMLSAVGMVTAGALADDGDIVGNGVSAESAEPTKLDKALAKFNRTGEMKKCLIPHRIRRTKVVDDDHIIFEITSREQYLNTLPRTCRSLDFHQSIIYTVRGGSLCSTDTFRVLDQPSFSGTVCQFGKFEKLVRKDLKKTVEEVDVSE